MRGRTAAGDGRSRSVTVGGVTVVTVKKVAVLCEPAVDFHDQRSRKKSIFKGFPVVGSSHYPPVEFLRKFLLEKSAGTSARQSPSLETPQEGPTITKVRPGLKAVFTEMQKFKVGLRALELSSESPPFRALSIGRNR